MGQGLKKFGNHCFGTSRKRFALYICNKNFSRQREIVEGVLMCICVIAQLMCMCVVAHNWLLLGAVETE